MKEITTFLVAAVLLSASAYAQDGVKQNEIGFTFSNINSYGLTFKRGTAQKLLRLQVGNIALETNSSEDPNFDNSERTTNSFSIGARVGLEQRKRIVDNLEFRYGFDGSFAYENTSSEQGNNETNVNAFTPGINAVIGFNYVAKDKLVFGLEILPGFSYQFRKRKVQSDSNESETNTNIFRLNASNLAAITLAYRFTK